MANHFNDLLLQTLKDVGIRLERLEGRVDHIINEKADKVDVHDLKTELKSVTEKLDQKADKTDIHDLKTDIHDLKTELKGDFNTLKGDFNTLGDKVQAHDQRLDRIETGIKTLQWTMTAGVAIFGIILAFVRSC